MNTEIPQIDGLDQVTNDLVRQLASTQSSLTCLGNTPIPTRESLVDLINNLKSILFPGYLHGEQNTVTDLHQFLNRKITELAPRLAALITQALILEERFAIADSGNCDSFDKTTTLESEQKLSQLGQELAFKFLNRLPQIQHDLASDVKAAFDGDPACKNQFEVVLCYPGILAITVYRIAHELHDLNVPFLPRMMAEWVHSETGIDIHPGAQIGRHFFIDHGTGVVIGQTCIIGEQVKIYQGVTLGALSFPKDSAGKLIRDNKRHPTIENNVIIYANSTVLGGKTIVGHDSVIGSSAWVTRSVAPFTTVTMEKPKLNLRNETPSDFDPPVNYSI